MSNAGAEKSKRYRDRNAERLRAESRARYHANASEINLAKRSSRLSDPEPIRERERTQARMHYENLSDDARKERSARNKRYWAENKDRLLPLKRDKRYGLTTGQYESMLEAQEGRCAICKAHASEVHGGVLVVDHCHASGKVRGLLCSQCNAALGLLKDSPAVLMSAMTYIRSERQ